MNIKTHFFNMSFNTVCIKLSFCNLGLNFECFNEDPSLTPLFIYTEQLSESGVMFLDARRAATLDNGITWQ